MDIFISMNRFPDSLSIVEGRNRSDELLENDPLADVIIAEQSAEERRRQRTLRTIALMFLNSAGGDKTGAKNLADDFIRLLWDGGALNIWRESQLLGEIDEMANNPNRRKPHQQRKQQHRARRRGRA